MAHFCMFASLLRCPLSCGSDFLGKWKNANRKIGRKIANSIDLTTHIMYKVELRKQIEKHRQKLTEYIKNPDAFDNQGYLKNAPTPEIRERSIQGRIKHLEQEINAFEKALEKLNAH